MIVFEYRGHILCATAPIPLFHKEEFQSFVWIPRRSIIPLLPGYSIIGTCILRFIFDVVFSWNEAFAFLKIFWCLSQLHYVNWFWAVFFLLFFFFFFEAFLYQAPLWHNRKIKCLHKFGWATMSSQSLYATRVAPGISDTRARSPTGGGIN